MNRFENAVTVEILDKSAFRTPGFVLEAVHVVQSEEADQVSAIDFRNKTVSYYKMRDDIMNKLEWSAMLLNSKVADKKVIYQSLHQMFLEFIHLNYLYLSSNNSDCNICEQYYTNIIVLYNDWMTYCQKKQSDNKKALNREEKRLAKAQKVNERNRNKIITHVPHL